MTQRAETTRPQAQVGNGAAPPGSVAGRDTRDAAHGLVEARAQAAARRVHGSPKQTGSTGPAYVGLVTRAVAIAVDAAILNAVAAIVAAAAALVISVFPVSDDLDSVLVAVGGALYVAWVVSYFTTFWAATGQTPGNRLMQMRVTRPDGTGLRPRRALFRLVGVGLAAVPLFAGFAPILVNDRRRGFADWLADTVVVRAPAASGRLDRNPQALDTRPS